VIDKVPFAEAALGPGAGGLRLRQIRLDLIVFAGLELFTFEVAVD
jgi:hypothetical protein